MRRATLGLALVALAAIGCNPTRNVHCQAVVDGARVSLVSTYDSERETSDDFCNRWVAGMRQQGSHVVLFEVESWQ